MSGGDSTGSPKDCETAPRLLATVERDRGTAAPVPAQLLIIEEPPVANVASLPEPATRLEPDLATATTPVTPVIGGGSFDDAPTVTPGTYTETLLPGEQVFYRVRLDFGQQLVATVDAPSPGTPSTPTFLRLRALLYGPDRTMFARSIGTPYHTGNLDRDTSTVLIGGYTPTVLYRNRETLKPEGTITSARRAASIAGYYYVSLAAAPLAGREQVAPVTVRVRIAVNGQPSGQPAYAGSAAAAPGATVTTGQASTQSGAGQAAVAASGQETSSTSALPWVVAGIVGIALAAGAAYGWRRRTRHT